MAIELKIPQVGESITEVEIGTWLRKEGDPVAKDEPVVTIESEKATIELPAPSVGVLGQILKKKGETARIGEVIAHIESGDGQAAAPAPAAAKSPAGSTKSSPKPASPPPSEANAPEAPEAKNNARVMPAAARALAEHRLTPEQVEATGPGGRLLKEDVQRQAASPSGKSAAEKTTATETPALASHVEMAGSSSDLDEEIVPMTPLRRTLAQRLVAAQHNAALLTTVNEIDMSAIMALRKEFGEAFQAKYQVKLGFMSFFVKAVVDALKQTPQLNAQVRETSIVYHHRYDIGVAIGGGKGLVVPVVRRAERLSFAEIEKTIADYAARARDSKLKLEELQGGTFTVSNGGIYGSLLSTPIVNPPQSGILGLHAIQDRPVAREGAVVIRPMMYVALTYDHRIVDGREAVTFLRRIKEAIEAPARILLEI